MNKIADMREFYPQELFALSALAGGGGFAGLRALTEMMHRVKGQPKPQQKAVKLMVPPGQAQEETAMGGQLNTGEFEPHAFTSPKTASFGELPPIGMGESPTTIGSLLPLLAGLPAGFLGTKMVYDKYKGHEMQGKVDESKKRYLTELQRAQEQMKTAGSTPKVDKFCEAVAAELNSIQGA
jgi:hypothetical protein